MKKKSLILSIVLLIAVLLSVVLYFTLFQKSKIIDATSYNLLIITLDTTRADRIGAYGYTAAQTPNIDFLARNGVMFSNCHSPAPLTLSAHCSIFTGKYPISHQVRDNGTYTLPASNVTLAESMKGAGYYTYAVLAAYVLANPFGLSRGFDEYDDSLNSHTLYSNIESEIPAPQVYEKFSNWFETNYNRSFFAWVHFYDPHIPYHAAAQFADKFPKDMTGSYDAEVSFMDFYIGKIIQSLREKGILEKTLVVLAGDHGEAFGEHQELGHGIFCYEESLRVPLIFYNPGLIKKSYIINAPVDLIDIAPTIHELYHFSPLENIDGKSLVSYLSGEKTNDDRILYFESMHGRDDRNWAPLMGVIHSNYKYISLPEPELYDLNADKAEKNNLFLKMNRLARDMDKQLMQIVASAGANGSKDDGSARRQLTEKDKSHLQSLGYISSFSNKNSTGVLDPKKGILIENKVKDILVIISRGDTQTARTQIDELKKSYPELLKMPFYYDMMHRFYVQVNDPVQVMNTLNEAISLFPKDERFGILYVMELENRGKEDDARKKCLELLTANPRMTRAYLTLAEMEERQKNLDSAIEYYGKALEIEPRNIAIKIRYADLLMNKKDFSRALQIYDELTGTPELNTNPELLYKIAVAHFQTGSITRAESMLKQAIEIQPKGKYYLMYALVMAKSNRLREALENIDIVLSHYRSELTPEQAAVAQKAAQAWRMQ